MTIDINFLLTCVFLYGAMQLIISSIAVIVKSRHAAYVGMGLSLIGAAIVGFIPKYVPSVAEGKPYLIMQIVAVVALILSYILCLLRLLRPSEDARNA